MSVPLVCLHTGASNVSLGYLIDTPYALPRAGDGIMSAIDIYFTVKTVQGKAGEKRVVLTMNGKFLPHNEQRAEDNTA